MGLVDIKLEGGFAPAKERLLDAYDSANRPLIIHCRSGADLTGLAAALYKLSQGSPVDEARQDLSFRYLHPKKTGSKAILGRIVDQYGWDGAINPISLRQWIETSYDPDQLAREFRKNYNKRSILGKS